MSAHLRTRMAELDAQIVEHKRVLHELQQMRSDVERELYATATFPVLTLPPEITTEIFLWCLPFDPLCIPNGQTSTPVVLASVCRSWRDITHATPKLWSKLNVDFDELSIETVSQPGLVESLIDLWLSRAGSCPVSLNFSCPQDSDEPFGLSRLRAIIHRWADRVQHIFLDFGYESSEVDIRALELDSASFPLLQGARVDCSNVDDPNPTHTILFGNAPCLRTLCMAFGAFKPHAFTFPWPQLTKFHGTLYDLELFAVAPNLTELTCMFEPAEDAFPVTTHRNLTYLAVVIDCDDAIVNDDILHYLALPALKNLEISQMKTYDSLESFIIRSSPPLVSLSARADDPRSLYDHLFHLQRIMPLVANTLQNLEFSGMSGDDMSSVFRYLDPESYHITSLIFNEVDGPCDLYVLAAFLKVHSTRLRTFRVVWEYSPFLDASIRTGPSDSFEPLSDYLSRLGIGMDIYLGTLEKNYISDSGSTIEQNPL